MTGPEGMCTQREDMLHAFHRIHKGIAWPHEKGRSGFSIAGTLGVQVAHKRVSIICEDHQIALRMATGREHSGGNAPWMQVVFVFDQNIRLHLGHMVHIHALCGFDPNNILPDPGPAHLIGPQSLPQEHLGVFMAKGRCAGQTLHAGKILKMITVSVGDDDQLDVSRSNAAVGTCGQKAVFILQRTGISPIALIIIAVFILSALCADTIGGVAAFSGTVGLTLVESGVPVSLVQRLACIACGVFDSLPHAGAILLGLNVFGYNHKQAYKYLVVSNIVIPLIYTAFATILAVVIY